MRGQCSVLVVDDDSGVRDSLADYLEAEGFLVTSARNGAEGLARLEHSRPDVIVLDLLMPVMNGRQFLARLRANPATSAIPVVLMTGASPRVGPPLPAASVVLGKPFELEELVGAVRRLAVA